MRLVTWNANCRFREKLGLFSPTEHDALVIQECENTESSRQVYGDAGWNFAWTGVNPNKGLGIFTPAGKKIEVLEWNHGQYRYFLPARIADKISVVGVWAQKGKDRSAGYAGQINQFILDNEDFIRMVKPIIVGDFNCNAMWDEKYPTANHTSNNKDLESLGLKSLYHAQENCNPGQEADFTFFMYRDHNRPYHIDYAYLPLDRVPGATINIGSPAIWLKHSDHLPLYIDLAPGDSPVSIPPS